MKKSINTARDIRDQSVVVVWKKTERSNKKYMTVFNTASIDQINTNKAKNPVIPNTAPFVELGLGKSFVERWMKKYKLNKFQLWPPNE